MSNKHDDTLGIIAFVAIVLTIIAAVVIGISVPYWNNQTYEVVELTVVQDNDKTLYSCTTRDGQTLVFENEDMLFLGKTNSSDYAVKLKQYEGKCHLKITTRGYRVALFSSYQNIVRIDVLDAIVSIPEQPNQSIWELKTV